MNINRFAAGETEQTPATVAVITATNLNPKRARWLVEAHESLHANHTPFIHVLSVNNSDIATIKTVVGEKMYACPHLKIVDASAEYDADTAAEARNVALYQVDTEWVCYIDDDDILPPGSIDARVAASEQYKTDIHWVGGYLADLVTSEDGSSHLTSRWEQPAAAGFYQPGDMLRVWGNPEGMFPYGGGSLLMRTSTLQMLGGWGGIPHDEDILMHLALTNGFPGVILEGVFLHYRKHAIQWTGTPGYLQQKTFTRDLLWRRAELVEKFTRENLR